MRKAMKCAAVVVLLVLAGCGTAFQGDECQTRDYTAITDHDLRHQAVRSDGYYPRCIPGCIPGWTCYGQWPRPGTYLTCGDVVELYYK